MRKHRSRNLNQNANQVLTHIRRTRVWAQVMSYCNFVTVCTDIAVQYKNFCNLYAIYSPEEDRDVTSVSSVSTVQDEDTKDSTPEEGQEQPRSPLQEEVESVTVTRPGESNLQVQVYTLYISVQYHTLLKNFSILTRGRSSAAAPQSTSGGSRVRHCHPSR